MKTLPETPVGAKFDAVEQAKYREFKESRRGAADYMSMEGEFSQYLEDHYSEPPVEREALSDQCEVLVIGAGFAGLLLWYRLKQAGFEDVRFCEKGRRCWGNMVLEPLPGHCLRCRVLQLLPIARRDGVLPDYEVRVGV